MIFQLFFRLYIMTGTFGNGTFGNGNGNRNGNGHGNGTELFWERELLGTWNGNGNLERERERLLQNYKFFKKYNFFLNIKFKKKKKKFFKIYIYN